MDACCSVPEGGEASCFVPTDPFLNDVLEPKSLKGLFVNKFLDTWFSITTCISRITLLLNDVTEALNCKGYRAALFTDLSEAFGAVDHVTLVDGLMQGVAFQMTCQLALNVSSWPGLPSSLCSRQLMAPHQDHCCSPYESSL